MKDLVRKYLLPSTVDRRWTRELLLTLLGPLLILLARPLGLSLRQAAVVAAVLLAVTWWSLGTVKKVPASLVLILIFWTISGAGYRVVFSFPLSETFSMIALTYLFSQGIANSGLLEPMTEPLLRKASTPGRYLWTLAAMFFLTVYVIPQPLARLMILTAVMERFLKDCPIGDVPRSVLMYAPFLMYSVVNLAAKDADIIMNSVAAAFSANPISNGLWMKFMLPPTAVCVCLMILSFLFLFRRELAGVALVPQSCQIREPLTRRQKAVLTVIAATALMWMTHGFHGISNTLITLAAVTALFCLGILNWRDLKAIDGVTLIFLTAAFSIGGVLKACGAADRIFGLMTGLFPTEFSTAYLMTLILATMALHMVLGSNTTTLSVAVPGLIAISGSMVPDQVIVFTAVLSVSFHAILPFHSVSLMIGETQGLFPARWVARMALPATLLVYGAAIGVFLPYWKFLGLL